MTSYLKNLKIKGATIARIAALVVVLINQSLAIFGKNALPFTENMAYQIVSLVFTVIIVLINAWYNNDITKVAIMSGRVFDALKDGKISEEEIAKIIESAESDEPIDENQASIIHVVNNAVKTIKTKIGEDKE